MKATLDLEGLKNPEKWEVIFSYFDNGDVFYRLQNPDSDITLGFSIPTKKYPDVRLKNRGSIRDFRCYIQEAIDEDRIEVEELLVKREHGVLI